MKLNITLKDTNGEEISTQTLTTNEFGPRTEVLRYPQGKLNDNFTIEVDNDDDEVTDYVMDGCKSFRVEGI